MQTILIGFFEYVKEGKKKVALELRANMIPPDKGDGYYVRNYYLPAEEFNEKYRGLKAGKVDVEMDPFNSYHIQNIKNI